MFPPLGQHGSIMALLIQGWLGPSTLAAVDALTTALYQQRDGVALRQAEALPCGQLTRLWAIPEKESMPKKFGSRPLLVIWHSGISWRPAWLYFIPIHTHT